jgi:hypothetical protein
MKRDELIDAMRFQTDLDDVDVPTFNATMFLTEAFERTAAQGRHWPSYQTTWHYTVPVDTATVALDADTAEITSVMSSVSSHRLLSADHDFAEESFRSRSGRTSNFSVWGTDLYLWPRPSVETVLTVRGYRHPDDTWLSDPAIDIDLDSRLHLPLLHYAVGLIYAQQEDELLENQYMRRWSQSVEDYKKAILRPSTYRPIVLNGGEDQHLNVATWSNVGFDNL